MNLLSLAFSKSKSEQVKRFVSVAVFYQDLFHSLRFIKVIAARCKLALNFFFLFLEDYIDL